MELLGAIVYEYVPLHFHRARAWKWGFDLPARRPQHVQSYAALSTSASQQKGASGNNRPHQQTYRASCPKWLLPSHCCLDTCERMRGSQQLPGTAQLVQPAHSSLLHTGPFSVQQTKRLDREDWRATRALGHCGSSLGLEAPVGAIVYVPLHLHQVSRDSIQVLWPTCTVAALCSWTHVQAHFG